MKTNDKFTYKEEFRIKQLDQSETNNIIESFKRADRIQRRKLNLLFTLLIIAGLVFLLVLSLTSVLNGFLQVIIANIFVVIMILVAISLRSRYSEKQKVDYTLPMLELLKKKEHRYRFWNSEWIFVFVLILICNLIVSTIFRFVPISEALTPILLIVFAQLVYLPLLGITFLAEFLSWKKVRKPLRIKILKLINELEN